MALLLIIGLVLVGATVWLVVRATSISRLRAAERLEQIASYGFSDALGAPSAAVRSSGPTHNVGDSFGKVITRIGQRFVTRIPGQSETQLRKLLDQAGRYSDPTARFAGSQVLLGVSLPVLWLVISIAAGGSPVVILLGLVVALFTGWAGPVLLLRQQGTNRKQKIEYAMPELIDTLVTTVEAGIAFTASLQIAGSRFRGPLGEELRLMLQEQNMGLSVGEGLQHMVERCDSPSVRSFARAITQGELLGVSISQSLRDLSIEMRKRRRANAEERAHKAPVKILFPLVFLIFPAMFIVLLGPAVLSAGSLFGGGK
jgi:tight adherence protein C